MILALDLHSPHDSLDKLRSSAQGYKRVERQKPDLTMGPTSAAPLTSLLLNGDRIYQCERQFHSIMSGAGKRDERVFDSLLSAGDANESFASEDDYRTE